MTDSDEIDLKGERARNEDCVRERIHQPNHIRSHGVLLALDPGTLQICAASENVASVFASPAADLLGLTLSEVPGVRWPDTVLDEIRNRVPAGSAQVELGGVNHDVLVQITDGLVIVELEPSAPEIEPVLVGELHTSIFRLSTARDLEQLRSIAAQEMRRLTGFDRSMVYLFHPDGHGEVVGESCLPELEPYLGLHYPASDIPAQARELYLRKISRHLPDAAAEPVRIVPDGHPLTGEAIDLGMTELRSFSPHHRQFMLNMGTRASMSMSLISEGRLIGLISCVHRGPLHIPFALRRVCELLAQQLSLQLGGIEQQAKLRKELQVQRVRTQLIEQMVEGEDIAAGLVQGAHTVLDLVAADGAVVHLHRQLRAVGRVPDERQILALVDAVQRHDAGVPLVSENLGVDRPELAQLIPGVAGLVVIKLGSDGDCIVWFRDEVAQSVSWLGDQTASNRVTPLSPRNSFHEWKQAVNGRSLPWDPAEIAQVEELRRDIDNLLLRLLEAKLAHLGMHDALTGLPNRRLLMESLERALHRHARGVPVALLFIDLDHFKLVNDSYGHDLGDGLLIEAGKRIATAARSGDMVARLGGDEFMVLCEDTDVRGAAALAERIVAAFQHDISVGGRDLHVTASVGVTTAQSHSNAADLLREADTAMYRSKARGRNQASNFELDLRHQAMRRLDTEGALRAGFGRGEYTVHYQPIVRVTDGRLSGVEALLRWDRPGHGTVSPAEFIPLAEDSGFIIPLGQWVLDQALQQLDRWRTAGLTTPGFVLSVNLSPRQLIDPALVERVLATMAERSADPSELVFEITETTVMSDRSVVSEAVAALAGHGISISIDDFGTGYSSLSHLRRLPVRQLKVDRTFVAGLGSSSRDHALVSAVIDLAHDFGMTCVAEGVETDEQRRQLELLGCDYMQGYLIGRPSHPDQLTFDT